MSENKSKTTQLEDTSIEEYINNINSMDSLRVLDGRVKDSTNCIYTVIRPYSLSYRAEPISFRYKNIQPKSKELNEMLAFLLAAIEDMMSASMLNCFLMLDKSFIEENRDTLEQALYILHSTKHICLQDNDYLFYNTRTKLRLFYMDEAECNIESKGYSTTILQEFKIDLDDAIEGSNSDIWIKELFFSEESLAFAYSVITPIGYKATLVSQSRSEIVNKEILSKTLSSLNDLLRYKRNYSMSELKKYITGNEIVSSMLPRRKECMEMLVSEFGDISNTKMEILKLLLEAVKEHENK